MSRTLSHRIQAIEYIHADDGLPYRHDFERGDSAIELRKDGAVLLRNKRRKLWDNFTIDGKSQPFLINPRGVQDKPVTTRTPLMPKRRKMSALQRKYFGGKRKRNAPARAHTVNPPRRRRRRAVAAAPRRRRHRRNPPAFSVNGIIERATQGLIDGAFAVGGKAGVRLVSTPLPYAWGSMMDCLVEVGVGIVATAVLPRFLGNDRTRAVVTGIYMSPLEKLASQANIPRVSELLGRTPVAADTRAVFAAADNPRLAGYSNESRRLSGYANGARTMDYPQSLPSSTPITS